MLTVENLGRRCARLPLGLVSSVGWDPSRGVTRKMSQGEIASVWETRLTSCVVIG